MEFEQRKCVSIEHINLLDSLTVMHRTGLYLLNKNYVRYDLPACVRRFNYPVICRLMPLLQVDTYTAPVTTPLKPTPP
jgi:hypothetical protein